MPLVPPPEPVLPPVVGFSAGLVVILPFPLLVALALLPFGPALFVFVPVVSLVVVLEALLDCVPVLLPSTNPTFCSPVVGSPITLLPPPAPAAAGKLLLPLLGFVVVLFGGVANFVILISLIYTLLHAMAFTE